MATTAPPPSASFIRVEDFDEHFPEPRVPNNNIDDNMQQNGTQPIPFTLSAPSQNLPVTVITSATSEAGGSTTSSASELGNTNWIGKLLEYNAARRGAPPAQFVEETLPSFVPRFVCFVTINERPTPFGSREQSFARKKDAKQYASKLAVEWLMENGHIGSASSVATVRPANNPPTALGELSTAAKVVELCLQLRMTPPAYVMQQSDPATPMLWSGYAHFPQEGRVTGRIGEFVNVFGKKNAKDQCAQQVLEFLEGIKRHRMNMAMEIY